MTLSQISRALVATPRSPWSMAQLTLALLLLIPAIFCTGVHGEATSNIFASGCTNQQMKLECPDDHHIAVKRVFYGVKYGLGCARPYSSSSYIPRTPEGARNTSSAGTIDSSSSARSCCRPERGDCNVDDNKGIITAINTKCSGRGRCDLQVERAKTEPPCTHRSYTDYMTIVYDCVPVGDIVHFCTDSEMRGKSLYLSNAEYPGYLKVPKGGEICECGVFTTHPEGISVHSIDVLLAGSRDTQVCTRMLDIEDPRNYRK
ncbi:hypothetical protein EGW08_000377, partial [Elysia chlorotica]